MAIENFGSYQLLKPLAAGGMAQIFLARRSDDSTFDHLVVVKRILPHLVESEEFVRMFLDEARIAARLNHPNVVQIFDLGAQDGTYFIAMEYIRGEDVRRIWKRAQKMGRSLAIQLACLIVREACAGLDYAHDKTDENGVPMGIVHRDISPQNILVSFDGDVKVVDFGIAKASNQLTVTRSGVIKGKYAYMSPEQAQGKPLDRRSDIFALGIVLFELLTGKRLFRRGSDLQTLAAVTECEVPLPSQYNNEVPAELDDIVLRALAKEPSARYARAQDLGAALDRWLASQSTVTSTQDLRAFMQEVYAERLAKERQFGIFYLEDSQSGSIDRSEDKKSLPPAPDPTRLRPQTLVLPPPVPSFEKSVTEKANDLPPMEVRLPPKKDEKRTATRFSFKRARLWGRNSAVVFLLLGALSAAWFFLSRDSFDSDVPPKSSTKPSSKEVFLETETTQVHGKPSSPQEDASTVAIQAQMVRVRLSTVPQGAELLVDGVSLGKSPLVFEAEPHKVIRINAHLDGFTDEERRVETGKGPELAFELALRPQVQEEPKGESQSETSLRRVRAPSFGQVRFVVEPWADVECDGKALGQTPFAPKSMTVGDHLCHFRHPTLGIRTQRVIVRSNEKHVVTVKY